MTTQETAPIVRIGSTAGNLYILKAFEGNPLLLRMRVRDLDHLRQLARSTGEPPREFVLHLNYGAISRKYILWAHSRSGRHWWVEHTIDDSQAYYTDRQLAAWTNIPEAIQKGALYLEWPVQSQEDRDLMQFLLAQGKTPEEWEDE